MKKEFMEAFDENSDNRIELTEVRLGSNHNSCSSSSGGGGGHCILCQKLSQIMFFFSQLVLFHKTFVFHLSS